MQRIYNYRLDTSNLEDLEENFDLREEKLKLNWGNITKYFVTKGKKLKFKYWEEELNLVDGGYSTQGIKQIINAADSDFSIEKDTDGLAILNVDISNKIYECFFNVLNQEYDKEAPFFHFDILDNKDRSIYSSQDYGSTVLIYLTEEDFIYVTHNLISKDDLISLPEII